MKIRIQFFALAAMAALMLSACGGGGSSNSSGGSPSAAEQWLMFADDGSANSNNLTVFKASGSSPVQTPIPQEGGTLTFNTLPLGEIHFANGKGFVVITSGLTGPAASGSLASGGLAVIDLAHPDTLETTVVLASDSTGRASRIVHVYIDPEGKFLWANNDGPSGDANPDSVFRVDVDPASPGYLTYLDIQIGNGHKKMGFGRPSTDQPTAKKAAYISSLTEKRIDVIDDDPASSTYGQVIKIVRNIGSSPHGFDYSPASGRAFTGLTGGGVVSVDGTKLDQNGDGNVDIPDFDCGATADCSGDPSVIKLTAGTGNNPNLFAGYVHVHSNEHGEDMVYTGGYTSDPATTPLNAPQGFLTAISPGSGDTPPSVVTAIDLGDMTAGSFNIAGDKIYVPSSGNGAIHDLVKVVDADHDSGSFNTVIKSITVGVATGENRNGKVSPDGRVAMFPNTSTNTASVIDTETDEVIDTVTLTSGGPTAKNIGIVHLPVDGAENNH